MVECYDPYIDRWRSVTLNGRILLCGSLKSDKDEAKACIAYDPRQSQSIDDDSNGWQSIASLP
jgi:hypothetical protein